MNAITYSTAMKFNARIAKINASKKATLLISGSDITIRLGKTIPSQQPKTIEEAILLAEGFLIAIKD